MVRNFVEIFVDAPLEESVRRDLKAPYARAFAGHPGNVTGVSDRDEPAPAPELHLAPAPRYQRARLPQRARLAAGGQGSRTVTGQP
jgi:adenylylsulfate kinase-like enzyme